MSGAARARRRGSPTSGGSAEQQPDVAEREAADLVQVDHVEGQHQAGAEELEDHHGEQQPALAGQVVPEGGQGGAGAGAVVVLISGESSQPPPRPARGFRTGCSGYVGGMLIPRPRGALSATLFAALRTGAGLADVRAVAPDGEADAAIALWALYELHYRGFEDADDARSSGTPTCSACAATSSATSRTGCARGGTRRRARRRRSRTTFFALGRPRTTGRRWPHFVHRHADPRAGARAAAAALGLPPQGVRPDRLGGAAAAGARPRPR